MKSIENPINKILDPPSKIPLVFSPKNAAIGDTPNDKIRFCWTCKDRGYPHEAINFRKIGDGRLKTDGSREFESYQILNYSDDSPHEHRPYQYRSSGQK